MPKRLPPEDYTQPYLAQLGKTLEYQHDEERSKKLALAEATYADPILFSKVYLPHLFPYEIPWLHQGLFSILTGRTNFLFTYGCVPKIVDNFRTESGESLFKVWHIFDHLEVPPERIAETDEAVLEISLNTKQYTVIEIPRGFGKTTVAGMAVPIYKVVFQDLDFGVYISEAGPHAEMQLDNVRRDLEFNAKLIETFGILAPTRSEPEKWSSKFIETKTMIAMASRGRGAQVRGLNHAGHRPDLIIADDLEDIESVQTDHQRTKVRTWAYSDLLPALADDGRLVALGTMLHDNCLLEVWRKDPQFSSVKFGSKDRDGEWLWERKLNEKKFTEKKESYTLAGQLRSFYLEYDNQSTSDLVKPFINSEFIIRVPEADDLVLSAIYLDPAISQKTTADDSVIAVATRLKNGMIVVMDMVGGILKQDFVMDEYFRLAKAFNARFHGFESVAFQASLGNTFRERMFRESYYFEPIPVPHNQRKAERFMGILYPRIASGWLAFARVFPKLEGQLRDYEPANDNNRDDWIDAVCGCVEILDPTAAAAGGLNLAANSYKSLEEDLGNWRAF